MAGPRSSQAALDEGEVFNVDKMQAPVSKKTEDVPLYRVYEDSKIAISKSVGQMWRTRKEAAQAAYATIYKAWDEVFRYVNFYHGLDQKLDTPLGIFTRGQASENIIYSNLNIMLPAVYSKNPDITCSSTDEEDKPFCKTLEAVVNAMFKREDKLNAKQKLRRAIAYGLLTSSGIIKVDWTKKDDSREMATEELRKITEALKKAKDQREVEDLYGQLEALESQMEVMLPSGPWMGNVIPGKLIIDPATDQPDGSDANWMIEQIWMKTAVLNAQYTKPDPESDDKDKVERVLVYKPTHKVSMTTGAGRRDDVMGMVLDTINPETSNSDTPISYTTTERLAYLNTYYTECYLVWDKTTRRVMLFQRDDWTWPLWVWDDPLTLTRFFPYFQMQFGFSTGGATSVGEASFYLDHQDEINDINRQVARIRRTIFDFFFYNSNTMDQTKAETFIKALRGITPNEEHAIGVDLPEGTKLSDVFMAVAPPSADFKELFNKEPAKKAANSIANISDALRGEQFKTNTNEESVKTYQDSVKLSVGAKIDVVEDVVAQIARAIAELSILNLSKEDVIGLVGAKLGANWKEGMSLVEFNATYSLEIVAGSTEKPTSMFKKKESINVAQAVGQFAQAAPGAAMTIMLKMMMNAFPEIVVSDDDWELLEKEIAANLQKGISTGGAEGVGQGQPGQPGQGQESAMQPNQAMQQEIDQLLQQAPPELKQKIAQQAQQGARPEEILQALKQAAAMGQQAGVSHSSTGSNSTSKPKGKVNNGARPTQRRQ